MLKHGVKLAKHSTPQHKLAPLLQVEAVPVHPAACLQTKVLFWRSCSVCDLHRMKQLYLQVSSAVSECGL